VLGEPTRHSSRPCPRQPRPCPRSAMQAVQKPTTPLRLTVPPGHNGAHTRAANAAIHMRYNHGPRQTNHAAHTTSLIWCHGEGEGQKNRRRQGRVGVRPPTLTPTAKAPVQAQRPAIHAATRHEGKRGTRTRRATRRRRASWRGAHGSGQQKAIGGRMVIANAPAACATEEQKPCRSAVQVAAEQAGSAAGRREECRAARSPTAIVEDG